VVEAEQEVGRSMSQRARSLIGSFVLATLIAAPTAHAVCRSPKNICKHIDDCLQRTSDPDNKDAERIREGVRARNGKMVWAGAEACARELGRKRQFRQCSVCGNDMVAAALCSGSLWNATNGARVIWSALARMAGLRLAWAS
jgi:hypothetical protein